MRSPVAVAWIAGSLVLGFVSEANADIYRCRRVDGTQHYTNVRERGGRCQVVVKSKKKAKPSAHKAGSRHRGPGSAQRRSSGTGGHARYEGLIAEAARLYQLPHSFILAVMRVESGFNPTVVSHAGAMGLMQLMPKTARSMGVSDPFDVRQNILGGARYLRILANRFKGDLILTVAAYNAGEAAVEKYNGIPPYRETQRYVRRVLKHYYAYRAKDAP